MTAINLNKSDDFVKEFKVFNDGKAGVVENVRVRIEKKSLKDKDRSPDYKLIATDDKGEINEGFYYQVPDAEGNLKGFNSYQAQKLIQLAKGVLGADISFPVFDTPTETLDGVVKMVAPVIAKGVYRVAACYGTTKRRTSFLGFKSFGSFIQPMSEPNTLALGAGDSTVRAPIVEKPTSTTELVEGMTLDNKNLDWLNQ
jgi:hypothetical protein